MGRYVCPICGYVYDESVEGADWDSLPEDWQCPICQAAKSQFERAGDPAPSANDSEPSSDKPAPSGGESGGTVVAKAAPRAASPLRNAVIAHRVFGYVFLAIYVLLMIQMLPRLWTYQIEFPARTAIHIALGLAIGPMLILKISIVRFFRRLEQPLVPLLGTSMVVCSVVLIGISVPAAFQEALATSRMFTPENRQRVQTLLAQTDLDDATRDRLQLDTSASLREGQRVLRHECVACHDLRTVLAKPRTPENWRQTVQRMASRTTVVNPLSEDEQWLVTAYLIAISPQLQRSVHQLRAAGDQRDQAKAAAESVGRGVKPAAYDPATAKRVFESKCSQCHDTALVAQFPLKSAGEVQELVSRMVHEGLVATPDELAQIIQYLTESYVKPTE